MAPPLGIKAQPQTLSFSGHEPCVWPKYALSALGGNEPGGRWKRNACPINLEEVIDRSCAKVEVFLETEAVGSSHRHHTLSLERKDVLSTGV